MTDTTTSIAGTRRRAYSTSFWGMATVVMTESTVFAVLLAAYFFLRASATVWPPDGIELPELRYSIPFSVLLWASSAPILYAEHALRRERIGAMRVGTALTFVMGLAFVGYALYDFDSLHFGWTDDAYGSSFYVIVGLHTIHVVVGLAMLLMVQIKAWTGRYDGGRHASAEAVFLYWHFVDAVWLAVFPSLILSPHWR